jgi:DNA polymerase III epsilon subunit-like protein
MHLSSTPSPAVPPSRRIAVIDVETTGLSPTQDRVLEIAVISAELDPAGVPVNRHVWQSLIRPDRGEPVRGGSVHGISSADLADAPGFADVAGGLLGLLDGRVPVAHNLPFDGAFLRAEFGRAGIDLPDFMVYGVCTLRLARAVLPAGPYGLAACCARFGIPLVDAHTAAADALATVDLLGCLLTETRALWTGRPYPVPPARAELAPGTPPALARYSGQPDLFQQ